MLKIATNGKWNLLDSISGHVSVSTGEKYRTFVVDVAQSALGAEGRVHNGCKRLVQGADNETTVILPFYHSTILPFFYFSTMLCCCNCWYVAFAIDKRQCHSERNNNTNSCTLCFEFYFIYSFFHFFITIQLTVRFSYYLSRTFYSAPCCLLVL